MAFDWNEYKTFAEELNATRTDEAALRSAISRVYYAVFNQAYDYLRAQGFAQRAGEGIHKQVWDEYRKGHRTRKAVGVNGSRLHDNRVAVDYQPDVPKMPELLTESFRTAANLLAYLALLKQEESRH